MPSVSTFDLLWVRGVAVECMFRKTRAALLRIDDGSLQTEQGKDSEGVQDRRSPTWHWQLTVASPRHDFPRAIRT